ncbi:MAG: hypothetical protein KGL39_33845 [Patescibacteria group bacterium]|nr:hypothetical protein [Patescibacteria group bacterium]
MGQPIVQQFTTEADTSALDNMKSGIGDLEDKTKSLSTTFGSTGINVESLTRRLERPIAMIGISMLSEQLSGMGQTGQSATLMIERGLHAVAIALSAVNPIAGAISVTVLALGETFENMAVKSKDAIEATIKSLRDESDQVDEGAKLLLKKHKISQEQYDDLMKIVSEKNAEREKTEASALAEGKHIKAITGAIAAHKGLIQIISQALPLQGLFGQVLTSNWFLQMQNNRANEAAIGTVKDLNGQINKGNDEANKNEAILKKRHEIASQMEVDNMNLTDSLEFQKKTDEELEKVEMRLYQTHNPKILEGLEKRIEVLKQLKAEMDKHVSDLKSTEQSNDDLLQNMSDAWTGYAENIGQALGSGKESAKQVMTQMMQDQIKILGNGLIKQLSAKATASMADPVTMAIGLAEIAAISTIEAITGASGGGAPAAAPAAQSNTPSQMTMVNVNFQGGNLSDPGAIAIIMKGINKQVVQNNGQIVVTNVKGNSNPPPGLVA